MNTLIVCALLGLLPDAPLQVPAPSDAWRMGAFGHPTQPELSQSIAPSVALISAEEAPPSVQRHSGWYGKVYGGLGLLDDGEFDLVSGATTTQGDGTYDTGFLSGFAVGYDLDERWSIELDYTYRSNDIDTARTSGGADLGTGGDFASVAILANAIYRFRPGAHLRPYAGIGLGILQEIDADFEDQGIEASERGTLAYQFLVGASYDYGGPWSSFVEARYLITEGAELDFSGGADSYEADYNHLGLLAGVRYSF